MKTPNQARVQRVLSDLRQVATDRVPEEEQPGVAWSFVYQYRADLAAGRRRKAFRAFLWAVGCGAVVAWLIFAVPRVGPSVGLEVANWAGAVEAYGGYLIGAWFVLSMALARFILRGHWDVQAEIDAIHPRGLGSGRGGGAESPS
jgi:hypothetical protein